MPRAIALFVGLVLLAVLLPTSASAATCSLRGVERKLGPTYTTRLVVTRVSCTDGKRLVRSYYNCRKAAGGADGRCRTTVRGFRCTERRRNVISTQFDSTVTCKRGTRKVVHDYTQFT